jgi:hypothetical protein
MGRKPQTYKYFTRTVMIINHEITMSVSVVLEGVDFTAYLDKIIK